MRIKFKSIFILIALLISNLQNVSAKNILEIEGGDVASVGIFIKELSTGKVLVDYNSQQALTPASITKSVTTATALSLLGPNFTFSTPVELSGQRSPNNNYTWDGNIVITACGDPTIGSKQFKKAETFTDSIIIALKNKGVKCITGTVVIKDTMPDAGPVQLWQLDDIPWPYGAGHHGFNYSGNTVFIRPNDCESTPTSNLEVEVKPSEDDGGLNMERGAGSQQLTIWANAATRRNKTWTIETTIPDPADVYSKHLITELQNAGISISENPVNADDKSTTPLYLHTSPELTEICANLMKRSDNLFAEGMLRAIRQGKTRKNCLDAEKSFWTERGLSTKFVRINDGSGLSRSNSISPHFMADMLEWTINSTYAQEYLTFFPVAGLDGTLKKFLENSRLTGRLALKTGSMTGVQCYAGYKLDIEGNATHVVVIMVNDFFCNRRALLKQIESFLLEVF